MAAKALKLRAEVKITFSAEILVASKKKRSIEIRAIDVVDDVNFMLTNIG